MNPNRKSQKTARVRDRQEFPFLMIPKEFFTRFNPSTRATMAYLAVKFYTHTLSQSCEKIPLKVMAEKVSISETTLKLGIKELVKMGAMTVKHRSRKSPSGDRIPLPNLYEIVNLHPKEPASDDAI